VPTELVYHFPPQQDREGRKIRLGKPLGSRKRKFNQQEQRPHTEGKENRLILCFPSAGDVQPLPRSGASCVAVALEGKYHNKITPSPSFLLAFIAEQASYGTEYLFSQFGSAVLAVSCPMILPTPAYR